MTDDRLTTATDKLLALADELEQKATALRYAAQVLSKSEMTKPPPATAPAPVRVVERGTLIRQCLAQGPQSAKDIVAYLKTYGHRVSRAAVARTMHRDPAITVTGRAHAARWSMIHVEEE